MKGFTSAIAAVLLAFPALAQTYPEKPVRMVVPFPPGGASDALARMVAQKMGEAWQQQVVVDNRPGGVMTIATDLVSKAPPEHVRALLACALALLLARWAQNGAA
mgnify:CR=1 FL=1